MLTATVPLLFSYLTLDEYRSGEQRLLPEVVVECGFGGWIVTLKNHEESLQATIEVDVWEDIPSALEAALASGKMPWKEFKSFRKKKPKKGGS
jgi:hypothetical protein